MKEAVSFVREYLKFYYDLPVLVQAAQHKKLDDLAEKAVDLLEKEDGIKAKISKRFRKNKEL